MQRIPDKCRLLRGPCQVPPLQVGERTDCLMRGTVVVTSWTAARISWPRCQAVGVKGGSGVLLDDELARAVRTEAVAVVLLVGCNRGTGGALVEPPAGAPWLDRAMKAGAW